MINIRVIIIVDITKKQVTTYNLNLTQNEIEDLALLLNAIDEIDIIV